jgi:WD40 repeat protein
MARQSANPALRQIGTLSAPSSVAVPGPLADATMRLAPGLAPGGATAGAVPAARLARAVGQAASWWAKTIPTAVLAGGVLVAALAGRAGASGGADPVGPATATPAATTAVAPVPVTAPAPDDPLPAGAKLRFGSPRFRHTTTIEGLAVSADGTLAVAHSGTLMHAAVRAYDLATGRVRRTFDRSGSVEGAAVSPDGRTVAIKRDFSVYLHDAVTGEKTARIEYPYANPSTMSDVLAFSPDGRRIVVAAATGKALHLIDVARGKVVRTFPHAHIVFAAAFSPDGRYLVAGGFESADKVYFARVREVDAHQEGHRLRFGPGPIRCVAYSPDGATVAVGGDGGKSLAVKLFDAATGEERLKIPFPDGTSVRSVAFSPDGRTLAASGGSSTRLFDAATGRERLKLDRKAIGLRFAPDGATLVGAVAGTIYRWDAATGRSLIPEGGDSPVAQIAVTPDGRRVVTCGQDGDGHIWDARSGEHRRRLDMGWQRGFALSPDGRFLAWPTVDESIRFPDPDRPNVSYTGSRLRMFDLGSDAPVERFDGFGGESHDLFFADGGRTLVTADRHHRNAPVRLWDVAAGRVARSFLAAGRGSHSRSGAPACRRTGRCWR